MDLEKFESIKKDIQRLETKKTEAKTKLEIAEKDYKEKLAELEKLGLPTDLKKAKAQLREEDEKLTKAVDKLETKVNDLKDKISSTGESDDSEFDDEFE